MSDVTSRRFFIVELLLIVAPLSVAFAWLGVGMLIPSVFVAPWSPSGAAGVVAIIAFVALLNGWVLVLSFLRGGAVALAQRGIVWWVLPAVGALILVASLLSILLPPSVEYSPEWQFRQLLELFAVGVPLLLPFGHLVAERRFRVV
jgi:hypothetical protein